MLTWIFAVAKKLWPELENLRGREQITGIADVIGVIYLMPLAFVGLVWLIAVTDLTVLWASWPTLLLVLVLLFVFDRLQFFVFFEVTPGTYADWTWSLWSVITWSVALIFGPSALWVTVLWLLATFMHKWQEADAPDWRWNLLRNLAINLTDVTLAGLIALTLYQRWTYDNDPTHWLAPLPGFAPHQLFPVFGATFAWIFLSALTWIPVLSYFSSVKEYAWTGHTLETLGRYMAITGGWRVLVDPFAVLAAGLYIQNGLGGYGFFLAGLLLVSVLAHQLSRAVQRSHLRYRELEKLEHLGRALSNMSPDASALPDVLCDNLRNMFPYCHIEICLFPDQTLLHYPDDWSSVDPAVWAWLRDAGNKPQCFLPGENIPWGGRIIRKAVVLVPIPEVGKSSDSETGAPVGGIYLVRYRDLVDVSSLLPALQSLAADIAAALRRAKVYRRTLLHQQVEQELALAGSIQATFLPHNLPTVEGWQITASLEPARQTSGDFYDVIPLPNQRLAILIADVADKGMGAALYMALSRTLLRTYAAEYHQHPDFVMRVTNHRILMDTQAGLFVTVFYSVLDPLSGGLTYCNAGHMPAYWTGSQKNGALQALNRTGMALGVLDNQRWKPKVIKFADGDVLVLYTDGITDAENAQGVFFGRERLHRVIQSHKDRSATEIQTAIVTAVYEFTGDAPQQDDITLIVIRRNSSD
jgi:serine phosphatase RsbU (regulator of sigma subunit)